MAWSKFTGGKNSSSPTVSSLAVTSATAVNVGDVICCAATWDTGTSATSGSITDSLGNSYTGGPVELGGDGQGIQTFACIVAHAGTPVVTLKFNPTPGTTAPGGVVFFVDVFTGSDSSSAVDGTGSQNQQLGPGTGTDAITSGSWTTTNDGCLIYSAVMDESTGAGPQTLGTGFSLGTSDGTVLWMDTEYTTQTTHGSIDAKWTANASHGTDHFITSALAVSPASGGGGGVTNHMRRIHPF